MSGRITLAVARRVLVQLRRDRRTLAMLIALPTVLMSLLWWIYSGEVRTMPGGAPAVDTFDVVAPGLLAILPLFVMFLVASVTTLRERSSGTLERLLAMPMGKGDFLAGYGLAFGLVGAVQAVLVTSVTVWALGLDVRGSVALLVLVAVADALLGTALGLLVSAFARTEFQAVQFMPAVVVPQILLCGLLLPRDQLPDVLHVISDAMPLSWAVDAMHDTVAGTDTARVWLNLVLILICVLVALAAGAVTLRRRTE